MRGAFSAEDIRKLFVAADSSGQGNVSSQDVAEFCPEGLGCGAWDLRR